MKFVVVLFVVWANSLLACKMTAEGAEAKFDRAISEKVEETKSWRWCKEKSKSKAQARTWLVQMSGFFCKDRIFTAQINPDCSVTVEEQK